MRVELAREVFIDPQPEKHRIQAVGRLLETFDEGRHDWIVEIDDVDAVAGFLSRHYPTLAQTYSDLARMAAVHHTAYSPTDEARSVVLVPRSELAEHSSDLCRAAVIAVENIPGDRYFLVAVVHAFNAQRIRRAIDRGWVEFRHSGGAGSVPAVAEDAARLFHRSVRVVAVFDSDCYVPDHEGQNHKKAQRLREQQITAHVLLRREAENYAPDRVLLSFDHDADLAKRVDLLGRLLPHQRGHFDMKFGLSKVKSEQKVMYGSLEPDVRDGLSDGFGKAVLERMHDMREELVEADFEAADAAAAADLRTLLALIDGLV